MSASLPRTSKLPEFSLTSLQNPPAAPARLSVDDMNRLFAPPVNRTMRVLDREFFKKTVRLSAARIFNPKNTTMVRRECKHDMLKVPRVDPMRFDPDSEKYPDRKILMMRPEVKHDDLSTAHPRTQALVESKTIELIPYELQMTYDNWSYDSLVAAILPPDLVESDIPAAFSQAGHLAHLNLRTPFLPYKNILAELILDKSPQIETVVNKLDDVGSASVYRTFPMEILAGRPDTMVTLRAFNCSFHFDFAKVYWNSRLNHEHERMVANFKRGEAVADVMAGVGPFAIPSGRKGCIVWANDLNPDSYESLNTNITANKLKGYVTAFNEDGRQFIRDSVRNIYRLHASENDNRLVIEAPPPKSKFDYKTGKPTRPDPPTIVPVPPTFAHFVMNLPATAVHFLDAYIGSYKGLEKPFKEGKFEMPMVHVYTFHRETEESPLEDAERAIIAEISGVMGHEMTAEDVHVHDVRRVAPNKGMYCASFRLPVQVAFGEEKGPVLETREEARLKADARDWEKWTRDERASKREKVEPPKVELPTVEPSEVEPPKTVAE